MGERGGGSVWSRCAGMSAALGTTWAVAYLLEASKGEQFAVALALHKRNAIREVPQLFLQCLSLSCPPPTPPHLLPGWWGRLLRGGRHGRGGYLVGQKRWWRRVRGGKRGGGGGRWQGGCGRSGGLVRSCCSEEARGERALVFAVFPSCSLSPHPPPHAAASSSSSSSVVVQLSHMQSH